jgi:hypothetical protein
MQRFNTTSTTTATTMRLLHRTVEMPSWHVGCNLQAYSIWPLH